MKTALASLFFQLLVFSSLYSQQIKILYPLDNNILCSYDSYISWEGPQYDKCLIELSTDSGTTWSSLTQNMGGSSSPAVNTHYWKPGWINSDSCKLRISEKANPLNKDETKGYFTLYKVQFDTVDVNNVKMWIGSNGISSLEPRYQQSGFFWPKGSSDMWTLSYLDGLVWNGKVDNNGYRSGGNHFAYGLQPGNIKENGQPEKASDARFKIWKLKKNWDLLPPGNERNEYEYNYNNWPADLGAPWTDVNNDHIYTKGIDKPEIMGDETLFFVANDMDSARVSDLYNKSLPIGLECQVTVFAYNSVNELKDAVFKGYRIINKSSHNISDMYFSYFGDPDIGNSLDDYLGCDSSLGMGYGYNAKLTGDHFSGVPPAIGYMILGGPHVPVSSFTPMFKDVYTPVVPMLPRRSKNEIYTMVRGQRYDGLNMTDPYTNQVTLFPLSGDPDKKTGWYEGTGWPGGPAPYARWLSINTGPFTLAPKDTQEVVVAMIAARGTDNFNSVTALREKARYVRNYYQNTITNVEEHSQSVPDGFKLEQNYPNPFNPVTVISYSIPKQSFVELKVYDMLGREVADLVSKEQNSGSYKIQFNASSLPSGIYIYAIRTDSFMDSKKIIFLK